MPQQLCIIGHLVEIVIRSALQLYISCESQITRATGTYIIDGGELLMQRILTEESGGENGSRIQSSLNHGNVEAQRKDLYSILITIHNIEQYSHFSYNFHSEIHSLFLNEKLFRMSSYHKPFCWENFSVDSNRIL